MPRRSEPSERQSGSAQAPGAEEVETAASAEAEGANPKTAPAGPHAGMTQRPVGARKEQFLIAQRPVSGQRDGKGASFDFNQLAASLEQDPDVEVVRRLAPPGVVSRLLQEGGGEIIVARMPEQKAQALKQHPVAQLVVEKDAELTPEAILLNPALRDPGVLTPLGKETVVVVTVYGKDNAPVEGATVYLLGSLCSTQGITDANGQAQLRIPGEALGAMTTLYVRPRADYWSVAIANPQLDPAQNHVVSLTPLEAFPSLARFPNQELVGWGQRAMNLDRIPSHFRGRGVKIAVVDSGAATTHQDLANRIKGGFDAIARNDTTWNKDQIAHGSHCAGIIGGSENGKGIRGIAPEADLYAYKVVPEGRLSNLIEALDHCIEKQVDLINLSVGCDGQSQLLEGRIQQAKRLGIACIVPAGNSAGPVRYPASSPNAFTVAAIGKKGEFPDNSYHAAMIVSRNGAEVTREGYFCAKFSCFGPEIDACAPGVAIVSSVPDNNYAAWDGTSMAAAHVTGLAALILAHHPDFQGSYQARNERRVERLFHILRESCRPLSLSDPDRTGSGLPDGLKALSVEEVSGQALGERISRLTVTKRVEPPTTSNLEKLKSSLRRIGASRGGETYATAARPISPITERATRESDREQLKASLNRLGLAEGRALEVKSLSERLVSSRTENMEAAQQKLKTSLRKVGLLA